MSAHLTDQIKAVFFDHDDTLVGTIEPKWAEHKYIAKRYYGKNLTDDDIRQHWGKPLPELMCILYGTEDTEQAIAYNVLHHQSYPTLLFTATIPVLRHLHTLGKKTGIVTATNRFSFEHDLKSHNIPRKLVDYTQTADDTSFHKPNPKVFQPAQAWLTEQRLQSDQVLYVGDSLADMRAALGAGFNFLGVETGLVTAKQFAHAGALSIADVGGLL